MVAEKTPVATWMVCTTSSYVWRKFSRELQNVPDYDAPLEGLVKLPNDRCTRGEIGLLAYRQRDPAHRGVLPGAPALSL